MGYNIVIICQYGASSYLLEERMQSVISDKGWEINLNAVSEMDCVEIVDEADIVLIAPQLRFKYQEALKTFGDLNKPVMNIDPGDYGNLDGLKILELALNEIDQYAQAATSD